MTIKEKQFQLARHRLKQAEESIDEAIFLLSGKKSPRSTISQVVQAIQDSVSDIRDNIAAGKSPARGVKTLIR